MGIGSGDQDNRKRRTLLRYFYNVGSIEIGTSWISEAS